jgi:hypothetical protein
MFEKLGKKGKLNNERNLENGEIFREHKGIMKNWDILGNLRT